MSAVFDVADARDYARKLEKREAEKLGLPREQARASVARKLRMSPGTLENVSRGRLKDPFRLRGIVDRLRQAVAVELNEEITRLTHERDKLLAIGAPPGSPEIIEATHRLREAKAYLGIEE